MKPKPKRHRTRVRPALLAMLGCACTAALAVAPPQHDPVLRLSVTLTAPALQAADVERALLRVEYRAAASAAGEADIVDAMLVRLRRMETTVADIRRLVDTWPAPMAALPQMHSLRVAPSPDPEPGPSPARHYALAAAAAGLTFIGWLLKQRRDFMRKRQGARAARKPKS